MITADKIAELTEMAMKINQHYSDYWYNLDDSMLNGGQKPVYTASVDVRHDTIEVSFLGDEGVDRYFTFSHKWYEDLYEKEKLEKGYDPDLKTAEARLRELLKEVA